MFCLSQNRARLASAWLTTFAAALMLFGCEAGAPDHTRTNDQGGSLADPSGYSIYTPGNRYAGKYNDLYLDEVQQVFSQRCAVCHSCTNGPCQLNLTSYDLAMRGMNKTNPYGSHVGKVERTRPDDAMTVPEWRSIGFESVLADEGDASKNLDSSLIFQSAQLGLANEPSDAKEGKGVFSMEVVRALAPEAEVEAEWTCPSSPSALREHSEHEGGFGGMPWGMPALSETEFAILARWTELGSPGPSVEARARLEQPQSGPFTTVDPASLVASWESFLNGDSLREQLTARYIYEHSIYARWHFTENPGEFYRLVRSRTAAPAPVDQIDTEWANDDPGVDRVYYRLVKHTRVIETKVHVVWERSLEDLAHLKSQFLDADWDVSELPDYEEVNPFFAFAPIPTKVRWAFMRENSRMLYQHLGRGPICATQSATYAVGDHFWILFLDEDADPTVQVPDLGLGTPKTFYDRDRDIWDSLELKGSKWGEPVYREAFEKTLRQIKPEGLSVEDIWDGEGKNPNAWLTVLRHQHSTEVLHGNVARGGLPHGIWLISYANFERMYYNAAVHFKYWGSQKHKYETFQWQTYTRTEAEDLFLSLLPDQAERTRMKNKWTGWMGRWFEGLGKDYSEGRPAARTTEKTVEDLYLALYNRVSPAVRGPQDFLNNWPTAAGPVEMPEATNGATTVAQFEAGIRSLTGYRAPFVGFVPNLLNVRFGGEHLYTFAPARGYRFDKIVYLEGQSRRREEDTLAAFRGQVGGFSYLFMDVPADKGDDFLRELRAVKNEADWIRLADQYKVARNSAEFWPAMDWLHAYAQQQHGAEAGLLDLRFYDTEDTPF